jgi:hypothetical protein
MFPQVIHLSLSNLKTHKFQWKEAILELGTALVKNQNPYGQNFKI